MNAHRQTNTHTYTNWNSNTGRQTHTYTSTTASSSPPGADDVPVVQRWWPCGSSSLRPSVGPVELWCWRVPFQNPESAASAAVLSSCLHPAAPPAPPCTPGKPPAPGNRRIIRGNILRIWSVDDLSYQASEWKTTDLFICCFVQVIVPGGQWETRLVHLQKNKKHCQKAEGSQTQRETSEF